MKISMAKDESNRTKYVDKTKSLIKMDNAYTPFWGAKFLKLICNRVLEEKQWHIFDIRWRLLSQSTS